MNSVMTAPYKAALYTFGALMLGGILYAGYELRSQAERLERFAAQIAKRDQDLVLILGEVTRIRLEQSAGIKGPAGLLEKLKTYAPGLASAQTPEPDYKASRAEMLAIMRAFEALGEEAWKPVMNRIGELKASKNFDELKWLLEAAVRIDHKPGIELIKAVLMGRKLPSPRLRWHAANMLLKHDKRIAQLSLRRILLTESSRGINGERAAAYGMPIPDKASVATSGFHNFVVHYVRSGDDKIEDTLLMVMGRSEHDLITVQECVKALGATKCARAAGPIEKLYQTPPGFQHNPLFQIKCLNALANIQGEKARPFFERMLPDATTDTVKKHLERLLSTPITPRKASVLPSPKKK